MLGICFFTQRGEYTGEPVWEGEKGVDYRLKKTLWAFTGNRIAVRFEYEWHDDAGQWWRSHGNENWEFHHDPRGHSHDFNRKYQRLLWYPWHQRHQSFRVTDKDWKFFPP